MDTKSKKSNSTWLSAMLFIICVSSFVIGVWVGMAYAALYDYSIWYYPDGASGFWSNEISSRIWMQQPAFVMVGIVAISGIVCIASFIYLCLIIGNRNEEGQVILKRVDYLFTEIQLLIIGGMLMTGVGVFDWFALFLWQNGDSFLVAAERLVRQLYFYDAGTAVMFAMAILLSIIATSIGLWMLLSCIRKIKAHEFLRQSILGKFFKLLFDTFYKSGSVMRKVVLTGIVICILSATIFLAPVVLIAILFLAPKWVRAYEEIKQGVEEVKSGNLTYKIPVEGNGELARLASGINEISQASNVAVQNELKNQRMKTELISNVSHDLRTPLTSMVTYIDLLKKEGLQSENAEEYLDILDEKTNRLRQLTDDLFEAAKASSGSIPVRREQVDMLSLINQGLGEMDQRIADSGLVFVVNAEHERYAVWADGQLLWRVVENLFSNVLKYAQENTRVYIDISEQGSKDNPDSMVVLEMKNISKQALNIQADELMERFTRGDSARSTEGSGLGLTIAKDLMKLQNGWFEIKIDGDLFKVTVMLEKAIHCGTSI